MSRYPEEQLARRLFEALQRQTKGSATVQLEGRGVHWACVVTCKDREVVIHVFHYPQGEAEYLLYFNGPDGVHCADARIRSENDAIAASGAWIGGDSIERMYTSFPFVDESKRTFQHIEQQVMSHEGLRDSLSSHLNVESGDFYDLRFDRHPRACRVEHGYSRQGLEAHFDWDDCMLFQVVISDLDVLALLVKRWLVEQVMPSELRKEFPWLEIGSLADAYEQGNPIEGEFLASWDAIEAFFGHDWNFLHPNRRQFIQALRVRGYDRCLRAGQSMTTFILSRSRRHGLQAQSAYVALMFGAEGLAIEEHTGTGRVTRSTLPDVSVTTEVEAALDRLVQIPIG
ncbi:hypothetical protein GO986_15995 [Deinococcus sp. HMF7620]|uniref:Uncharacterized protein n=1 Tax=Deinococcus arboris TaxID=2682977 RepID=A0A7C9HT25_9DEIO|nr:hypothetical protein [Deinococcus arboris]MVN88249.1 hypothetical protein [Deinococcus arboris]